MMNGWISIKELKWKCRVVDSVMVIQGGSGSPGNTRNESSSVQKKGRGRDAGYPATTLSCG